MKSKEPWDVIVIGAGPAGSSAAAILAEHGRRVLVLEREKFPRYHIGESLLPFTFYPLERLGLIDAMRRSAFVKKYSVQFVSPNGNASQPFYFFNRYDRATVAQTWQVLRSEFDQMLVDNARRRGATIFEQQTVRELLRENGRVLGVRAVDAAEESADYFAPITIDCSGKEAFAMGRNLWRVPDPHLNKVAVWTYYEGAARDAGIDEGATTVAYVQEKGWFWYIPQHNNFVSVGVVAEGKYLSRGGVRSPEEMFQRELKENVWIDRHVACGKQTGPYYLTSEFTHHSRYCATDGLLLAGDAFCFLDPVFSSGVLFAMKSGIRAADDIHHAMKKGDLSPSQFTCYGRSMRTGIENMRKLVYAFYDPAFSFRFLTDKYPDVAGAVTDCLSGEIDKDFTELWRKVSEFVTLPTELEVGDALLAQAPANNPAPPALAPSP